MGPRGHQAGSYPPHIHCIPLQKHFLSCVRLISCTTNVVRRICRVQVYFLRLETRKQRSELRNFDVIRQDGGKLTYKTNASIAWHVQELLVKGKLFCAYGQRELSINWN